MLRFYPGFRSGSRPHRFTSALYFSVVFVCLEEVVSAESARVHDAFGSALVIEVKNLLAEMEIF